MNEKRREEGPYHSNLDAMIIWLLMFWKSKIVANNWLRHPFSVITTWSCQWWRNNIIVEDWINFVVFNWENWIHPPSLLTVVKQKKGWIFWLISCALLKCLSRTQNMAKYFLILAKNNIWKVRKFGMTKILVIHSTWRRKTSQLSLILDSLSFLEL